MPSAADKRLSQSIAAKLLSPALAAFDAIAAGQISQAQLDSLEMTAKLARFARQRGVKLPADSQQLANVIAAITAAFGSGGGVQLDDDDVAGAVRWLKACRNQLTAARPDTLLALIDDLTLVAGLKALA